jgi:transposase-like protein
MSVIVEGTKKFKCKVCGCKFTLNNDYAYTEKTKRIWPIFGDDYTIHYLFVKCPQCGNLVKVNEYKIK